MVDFKDVLYQKEVKNLDVIPFKIADLLNEKKYTLSIAESITGGDICSQVVRVSGASNFFTGGVVAYNNFMKVNECLVNPKTISRYSAVSSEVCMEMAKGIKQKFQTNVAIATTGFAGPQKDKEKVGLVYIGIIINKIDVVKKMLFTGDREEIIKQTTFSTLELLRYYLGTTYQIKGGKNG